MQPIPLGAAGNAESTYLLSSAAAFFFSFLIVMTWRISKESQPLAKGKEIGSTVLAVALGIACVSFVAVSILSTPVRLQNQVDAQTAKAGAKIEDRYGLKLSPEEVSALAYPAKPSRKDLEIYGSTELKLQGEGPKSKLREVYLVWNKGEVQLGLIAPGEPFDELPVRS